MRQLLYFLCFFLVSNSVCAQQTNPIVVGNARFTIITPELIRMEYSVNGKFVDEPTLFAYNRKTKCNNFKLTVENKKYIIETAHFKLQYINDGFPFSQMNIRVTVYNLPKNYEWRTYSVDDKNLGGTAVTLDNADGAIKTEDGLLSRNGWHLIDDTDKELLKNEWIEERPREHIKDFYLFAYGTDFRAALKALTAISGDIPMPRKYVHGSWYCRWWDYTADEYRQIVKEYKEHDFPLDVLVMDMGWHTQKEATTGTGHSGNLGWTGYTWNPKLFPDPKGLLRDLKSDNLFITLNDHPHDGIRHHEAQYANFMKAMNIDTVEKKELLFNAGNKTYMDNFFKYALDPNEKIGVDFWWLDWQQDYLYPHVIGYRNLLHLDWLNFLYYKHSENENKRGLHFSRWGGWGSHRYPIQFSGDAIGSWDMLKYEIPFTTQSGNAGCFFWAHDIGGFYADRNSEIYVRWTQFGLTNASLRVHSVCDKELDRRPWLWGKDEEKAMKIIYHLRSQLMPYIYSSVAQCHTQSVPLLRSMYIEYPKDEAAYTNPQQYLFGDLFLAAPITSPGEGKNKIAKQKVWFPSGNSWYNFFNHGKEEGGTSKEVSVNLFETPLYVKGGYPVVMQNYRSRMSTAILDTLVIRCYPGDNQNENIIQLYEDDGLTKDYINGDFATTDISYKNLEEKVFVNIAPCKGQYKNQPNKRVYQLELMLHKKIKVATANNKKLNVKYQKDKVVLWSNQQDIRKAVRFVVE